MVDTTSSPSSRLIPNAKRLIYILTVTGFLTFMVSCSSSSTGSNGGGDGGGNGGDDDTRQPTFTNVQQIFNGSCGGSGCHIDERTSGVRLDTYDNATNSVGDQYGILVIQPGDADGSPLVDKIEPDPEHGERMPLGQGALPQDDIDLIREWINQGANNN